MAQTGFAGNDHKGDLINLLVDSEAQFQSMVLNHRETKRFKSGIFSQDLQETSEGMTILSLPELIFLFKNN